VHHGACTELIGWQCMCGCLGAAAAHHMQQAVSKLDLAHIYSYYDNIYDMKIVLHRVYLRMCSIQQPSIYSNIDDRQITC
jgi:hypothetical protein